MGLSEADERRSFDRLLRGAVRRDRVTPAWAQLRDCIREAIAAGAVSVGSQLPGEPDLARLTGVGRPTVRQALDALRRDGWVVVQRGRGTFVASRRPRLSLLAFEGLTRTLSERGFNLATRVLRTSTVERFFLPVLGEELDGPLFTVDRLRTIDGGTALLVERDALPLDRFPDADVLFATYGSVGDLMRDRYGQTISHSRVGTRATCADSSVDGAALGVPPGEPLLEMERLNYGFNGEVLHAVRFQIRTNLVPVIEEVVNPL